MTQVSESAVDHPMMNLCALCWRRCERERANSMPDICRGAAYLAQIYAACDHGTGVADLSVAEHKVQSTIETCRISVHLESVPSTAIAATIWLKFNQCDDRLRTIETYVCRENQHERNKSCICVQRRGGRQRLCHNQCRRRHRLNVISSQLPACEELLWVGSATFASHSSLRLFELYHTQSRCPVGLLDSWS